MEIVVNEVLVEGDNGLLQLAKFAATYSNNNLRLARRSRREIDLASTFLVAPGDCDVGGGLLEVVDLVAVVVPDTAAVAVAMVLLLFKREKTNLVVDVDDDDGIVMVSASFVLGKNDGFSWRYMS